MIEVYLMHIYIMLQLAKQITAAGVKCCVYAWIHPYYDMGVAMVDCVIVIVYILHL